MSGKELKQLRQSAEISGQIVCSRAGIARSRLSEIERGYVNPAPSEAKRIADAIESLKHAKQRVAAVAAEVGWPI